jgi:hypothetical protein
MATVGALVRGVPAANLEAMSPPCRGPVEAVAEDAVNTGLLQSSMPLRGPVGAVSGCESAGGALNAAGRPSLVLLDVILD